MRDEYRSAAAPPSSVLPGGRGAPRRKHRCRPCTGHFARFNEWAVIRSSFEGNFLERIQPGAFAASLAHDRARIEVLFQHGRDPQIGDKVLGVPTLLREDELGALI